MADLGILGPRYTYHDLAREKFLPDQSYAFYASFEDIFSALKKGKIRRALVAITNNSSGKVSDNLERIKKEGFKLIKQFDLPIHLYLGSKKQTTIERIRKIYSHPMAIKETRRFFSKYSHITFVASSSTSGAIDELKFNRKDAAAVISSKEAIMMNDLTVITENIEDYADNTTTFSLIEMENQ